MTGLRERSKQRRRQLVLDASENLFRERSYGRTTIEEIAAAAEVSIGTIYTYFGSKGGIMRALMMPVIETMKEDGEAILASPPKRASDAIIALFEAYRFSNDWKHLNLLKALDPRTRTDDEELYKLTEAFDEFIQAQLSEMLRILQREGRLNEAIDIGDAVFILYMLLTRHFDTYLLVDGQKSYEEILVDLHRRLRLIIRSWT